MVMDALRAYAALASGLTEVPRERAAALAKALLDQGGQAAGVALPRAQQVQDVTEGLLATSRSSRDALLSLVRTEASAAVGSLEQRVVELEAQVASLITQVPVPHLPRSAKPDTGPPAPGQPATQPAPEAQRPATKPATATKRATKAPATAASRKTATQTKPATKPATKSATKRATKPATKRATKPAATSATAPAEPGQPVEGSSAQ